MAEAFGNLSLATGGKHGYKGVRTGRAKHGKKQYQGYTKCKKHFTKLFDTPVEASVALARLKQDLELGIITETETKKPRKKRGMGSKLAEKAMAAQCTGHYHQTVEQNPLHKDPRLQPGSPYLNLPLAAQPHVLLNGFGRPLTPETRLTQPVAQFGFFHQLCEQQQQQQQEISEAGVALAQALMSYG